VFHGVGLFSNEIDKLTLTRGFGEALRRWEFLRGKFTGLVLTLTVIRAAMAAGLFLRCGLLNFAGAVAILVALVAFTLFC